MFLIERWIPLFDVEGGGGGDEPPNPEPQNPLRTGVSITEPEPIKEDSEEPSNQEQEVEEIDFGGRKVKVVDPVLKDLHKDYTELAGTLTRESQRSKQLEAELEEARRVLENLQEQPSKESQETASNEPDPERLQQINEQYQEMAYEDPINALVWLNQQPEYQQLLRPVYEKNVQAVMTESQRKQEQVQEQIKRQGEILSVKHTDFKSMLPAMDKVVTQYPHLRAQMESNPTAEVMETIYFMAKGLHGAVEPESNEPEQKDAEPTPNQTATIDDLIKNPEFIQKVLENEQVKQTIIKNYLAGVNNSQQVPEIIGNQPGATSFSMPEKEPETIKEAGKGFRAMLRQVGL